MKTRTHDNNTRGQALIELALVLPLLVLLVVGVFDFSRAIHANNIISNVSREGANLSSRTSFAAQDIMNVLADTAQPLKMQNNGMMYITVVTGVTGGDPAIQLQTGWQNSSLKNTISSRLGTSVNPTTHSLAALNLQTGQTVNVVEVFYNYQSLFSSNAARLGRQLYSRTIL